MTNSQIQQLPNADTEYEYQEPSYESVKLISTSYMNPVIWKQMKGMAATFIESRALPQHIQNVAQAVMVMQAGLEMNMKPVEALQSLYIVNGSINIWGKATTRRLREHGYQIEYSDEDDNACTATVVKRSKEGKQLEKYSVTFLFEDAERSGWTKSKSGSLKFGWLPGQNRKLKMRYSALSELIKSYIPEVLGSAEEVAEIAQDFEVIEVEEKKQDTTVTRTKKEVNENLKDFLKKKKERKEQIDIDDHLVNEKGETVNEVKEKHSKKQASDTQEDVKDENVTQDITKKRKEYFAVAKEAGMNPQDAKEHIKDKYEAKSFNDLTFEQIDNYVKQIREPRN